MISRSSVEQLKNFETNKCLKNPPEMQYGLQNKSGTVLRTNYKTLTYNITCYESSNLGITGKI